jgi:uncharacterized protein (DUF1778 family)
VQPSSAVINVRAPIATRDLIDRAAQLQGKSRTDSMLEASAAMAQQTLLNQILFQVSEEQLCQFEKIMNQPLAHNEKLRALLASKSPWD